MYVPGNGMPHAALQGRNAEKNLIKATNIKQ